MPDFGRPVAAGIQTPNLMSSVSQVMNVAKVAQDLKIGQSNVQQAQQQMRERELLQSVMASGKTPDGSSIRGPNGEVDPSVMAKYANTYLPLTGQALLQNIIATQHNRIQLMDATRQLGQNTRSDLSGIVSSSIGMGSNPQKVGAALDAYGQQNPQAASVISRSKSLLANLGSNPSPDQMNKALLHLSRELQPEAQTASEQIPGGPNITGPNGGVQAVNRTPYSYIHMGAIGPEVQQGIPLEARNQFGINPTTGGPMVISKSGQGQITGLTNPPTHGVFIPSPGDVQALPSLQAERVTARQVMLDAPTQHTNNAFVLNNIDKVAATGPVGPTLRNIASAMGVNIGPGVDSATAFDLVGKGLERSALQAAQSMGPSTNAGLDAQIKANGTLHYTPQAIKEITHLNDALVSGTQSYQPGLEKAIAANPSSGVFVKRQYDQEWGANFDPRIFELYNAAKSGDTATLNGMIRGLGGKGSQAFKNLMLKAANLNKLSDYGTLQ